MQGRSRLLPLIVALASCQASLGATRSVVRPTTPPVTTESHSDAPPTAAPVARDLEIPPGNYTAAVLSEGTVRFASWVVNDDGRIRSSDAEASALELEEARVDIDIAISFDSKDPASSDVARESCAGSACRSMPELRGRLSLPGDRERPVRLQWYGDRSAPHSSCLIVSVDDAAPSAVVLDTILRSPAGPWLAPTLGDLDGDQTADVAFVAMGVGTCGGEDRPDCEVLWVDVLASASDGEWEGGARGVIARNKDLAAMSRKLGADPCLDGARWSGRIESGTYAVEATGPGGSLAWTVQHQGARWSVRAR